MPVLAWKLFHWEMLLFRDSGPLQRCQLIVESSKCSWLVIYVRNKGDASWRSKSVISIQLHSTSLKPRNNYFIITIWLLWITAYYPGALMLKFFELTSVLHLLQRAYITPLGLLRLHISNKVKIAMTLHLYQAYRNVSYSSTESFYALFNLFLGCQT